MSRIYGNIEEVDSEKIKKFFNNRAKKDEEALLVKTEFSDKENVEKRHKEESELLLNKIDFENKKILEIGCGIGRWAEVFHDKCDSYLGIDYSEDLIEIAKENYNYDNCHFQVLSASQLDTADLLISAPFDIVIITGVLIYFNDDKGYTAFMVNICETSSGVHYDIDLISDFCKRNNLFLVVDAVSSFLADYINMSEHGVDVVITGSQKALACPPGIAIITLSGRAVDRVNNNSCKSMYFDLKDMLLNAKRGQTPYTPAITILLQINARLNQIKNDGGVKVEIERTTNLANDFRNKIKEFPFEVRCKCLSNAVTTVHSKEILDVNLVEILKNEYDIWVSTARDDLSKDMIFRVGHMGDLSTEDNDALIDALRDIQKRGLF